MVAIMLTLRMVATYTRINMSGCTFSETSSQWSSTTPTNLIKTVVTAAATAIYSDIRIWILTSITNS